MGQGLWLGLRLGEWQKIVFVSVVFFLKACPLRCRKDDAKNDADNRPVVTADVICSFFQHRRNQNSIGSVHS
jgi:hypothetical protein